MNLPFGQMPKLCNWISAASVICLFTIVGDIRGQEVPKSSDMAQRLERLEKLIEEQRVENHIPGLAIAIVKDDQIIFAKGFGYSDLEKQTAVDTDTLFAIGSSTKQFTSTLVAMLVDEGKMNWDDPVTKYIADFKMKVDTGDKSITIRDLLCHRTGFTRMGILWASGSLTREEVIKQAGNAEPYDDFQKTFLYNNVMYMTAGECAGIAAGSSWDALTSELIFKPLGMSDSDTSIKLAHKNPKLALGYMWDDEKQDHLQLPMRNLDSIGPSGSINSNVKDMSNWLRFQLANGKFDGKQLLSKESQAETWTKQINVAGEVDYGMGWMLHEWQGKKVIEHGGNIDGFAAQVTLLPEENVGYVILANVTVTPLQQGSISLVFNALFGDETETGSLEGIDTDELTGNYIANFGPFSEAKMEVSFNDGKLAINVPGQMNFDLKPPGEDGKWYFALTDTIAVSFNKNEEGKIISLTMFQGGMEPEFVREDIELKPETPLNETAPLVGKYRDEKNKVDVVVVVRNGRLVVETGVTGTFDFLPADKEGKWAMRAKPDLVQIRFNKNEDGTIKSVTRFQKSEEFEMLRISDVASSAVPTVDEMLEKMRAGYGKTEGVEFAGVKLTGTGTFVHQGAQGTIETIFSMDGKHATRQDFGKMAVIVEAFDGEKGYSYSNVSRFEELEGSKLVQVRLRHPLWLTGDWREVYSDVSITGDGEVDGEKVYVMTFSGEDIADRKLYVSPETGLILKERAVISSDTAGQLQIETVYSDFREVDGMKLPFKAVSENPMMGKFEIQYESAETLAEIPGDTFVVRPPDAND